MPTAAAQWNTVASLRKELDAMKHHDSAAALLLAANTKNENRVVQTVGFAFGVGTQILFLWTVVNLFQLVRAGVPASPMFSIWTDLFLAILFSAPHSL